MTKQERLNRRSNPDEGKWTSLPSQPELVDRVSRIDGARIERLRMEIPHMILPLFCVTVDGKMVVPWITGSAWASFDYHASPLRVEGAVMV